LAAEASKQPHHHSGPSALVNNNKKTSNRGYEPDCCSRFRDIAAAALNKKSDAIPCIAVTMAFTIAFTIAFKSKDRTTTRQASDRGRGTVREFQFPE
jgi:hypothetical protein